jgi:hypothetical protein
MLEKLLSEEFWQTVGTLIARTSIIIPVLIAFILGMIVQRFLDSREIRGLKADKNAAETRLKLAQDKQEDFTAPVQILNSPKLEEDVAVLQAEMVQIKEALPPSVFNQLDQVAARSAFFASTARALSEANTVLGSTLSYPSFSQTLRTKRGQAILAPHPAPRSIGPARA